MFKTTIKHVTLNSTQCLHLGRMRLLPQITNNVEIFGFLNIFFRHPLSFALNLITQKLKKS